MASFTLLITSSPFKSTQHEAALRFARAALSQKNEANDSLHCIKRVFFYGDAVLVANVAQQSPQGQQSTLAGWLELAKTHQVALHACIANSLRRGIADESERSRYDLEAAVLHPTFQLMGLGEMTEAYSDSDRLIQF
ncbi:MAG: sulfurtransferase complex subunit TusD [Oleibacter sp.]|nr:sulfurtransferase complex subunit TusD [Thalassolituus sp.]